MKIKKIQDTNVNGKKIIVRADFNVSRDEYGHVKSVYKIAAVKNTVDFLIKNGASHVALLTHFGRPDGKVNEKYSLKKMVGDISGILERDIEFVSDCIGEDVERAVEGFGDGKVILLENVRFYEEEKKDVKSFASKLCKSFDIYVSDAFAVCHRKHASVHAITTCIPSFAGLWVQKELKNLKRVKHEPEHPAVAIIGGSKIETKVPMMKELAGKYDTVLVGGKTAVEARDKKMKLEDNVVLPIDFEYKYYDIGTKTIENFCKYISTANTIVWNGPMGLIEKEKYKKGTLKLIEAIAQNKKAFSLIGGGESAQMVEESGLMSEISFVSTGGGAMLAYLGGEEMPGIDVLICDGGKCV
ncbi:MAG: phosphoglycerate kinase [Candidatus Moraniibacteriota bacterium]|jgi:phosphoglycerate kinase